MRYQSLGGACWSYFPRLQTVLDAFPAGKEGCLLDPFGQAN